MALLRCSQSGFSGPRRVAAPRGAFRDAPRRSRGAPRKAPPVATSGVGVDGAAFQGLELGAALVGAALRTMGVTDAATGKCTNEALADFISAWAGVTRASAIVSVCLAEDRDDNATRKDLP